MSQELKDSLTSYIKKRLAPQPIKVRCDLEVTCFTYEGILAVKEALLTGQKEGTIEAPVKINLIAPPLYVMKTLCLDKDLGIEVLNKVLTYRHTYC